MAPAAAPLLAVRGFGRAYRTPRGTVRAVEGVELAVADGEFLSLLGPSGCGKSTLLRCIAGLDSPTEGEIRLRDVKLAGPPRGLGMVFQRDVLLDWRSILDNVLLSAELEGLRGPAVRARALALLDRFGLTDFANQRPWELSGGMRQRAAICRALLCEPPLLLMDEPFGALDAITRDDLNLELSRIQQLGKRTVVFVTHSITEAVYLSDRVAVMSARPGRIAEVFEIDLPRPRPLAVRETPEFARYTAAIHALFARLGIMRE